MPSTHLPTALAPDDLHIWLAPVPAHHVLPAAVAPLLDHSELERLARFSAVGAAWEYLTGRLLVRTVLSHYLDVAPAAWRFVEGEHGRPEISAPDVGALGPLRFNLSHTRGLAAVALCWRRDVGVDVEDPGRRANTVAVADRYFAATEVAALRALPARHQVERFFTYWTLKEAYIKARGLGLALPLGKFAFEVDADPDTIGLVLDADLDDTAARWHFEHRKLASGHHLAMAVAAAGVALRGRVIELDEGFVERMLDSRSTSV